MSRRSSRKARAAEMRTGAVRTPQPRLHGKGVWQAGNGAVSRIVAEMQQAFAEDFSSVQVHAGPEAQEPAAALGATAFTRGDHIYLGAQAPTPESEAGRRLIAHELAHVVQQRRAGSVNESAVGPAGDSFEQSADHAAARAVSGKRVNVAASGSSTPGVQLQRVEGVSREETEEIIKDFLKTAPRTPTGSIDIPRIQTTFINLALAPAPGEKKSRNAAGARMRDLFNDKMPLPGNPRDLAPKLAGALDYPMDWAALQDLHPDPKHKPTLKDKIKKALGGDKDAPPEPLAPLKPERKPGEVTPGQLFDEGAKPKVLPAPVDKVPGLFPEAKKPTPHADPEDFPKPDKVGKKTEPPKESTVEPDVLPPAFLQPTPQTGLGVLPSAIDSAITEARGSRRTEADLILGKTLLPQQEVVFGQVQHLLQMHARDTGAKVTAVNVFMGGKLVKTVRLGVK